MVLLGRGDRALLGMRSLYLPCISFSGTLLKVVTDLETEDRHA